MKTCYVDYQTRAIADLARPGELYTGWTITRINVPRDVRGRGLGTKILVEIITDADAEGVSLWLEVSPSDGLNYIQLVDWYKRHGFVSIDGYGVMRRRPRA